VEPEPELPDPPATVVHGDLETIDTESFHPVEP
jgi:hypothetical protein